MKKTNIIVSIIVGIVVIASAFIIFLPNNNKQFKSYYNEIKSVSVYETDSSYFDIKIKQNTDDLVYIFVENPKEELNEFKMVVMPIDASLRFSKPFASAGVLEEINLHVVPKDFVKPQTKEDKWVPGINLIYVTNAKEFYIYLEFKVNDTLIKEYLQIQAN